MSNIIEPSSAEQSEWSDATRDYVHGLQADNTALLKGLAATLPILRERASLSRTTQRIAGDAGLTQADRAALSVEPIACALLDETDHDPRPKHSGTFQPGKCIKFKDGRKVGMMRGVTDGGAEVWLIYGENMGIVERMAFTADGIAVLAALFIVFAKEIPGIDLNVLQEPEQ